MTSARSPRPATSPEMLPQLAEHGLGGIRQHDGAEHDALLRTVVADHRQVNHPGKTNRPVADIDVDFIAELDPHRIGLRQSRGIVGFSHHEPPTFIVTPDGTVIARCPRSGRTASGTSQADAAAELARAA